MPEPAQTAPLAPARTTVRNARRPQGRRELGGVDAAIARCHRMPRPLAVATLGALLLGVWVLVEAFGGPPMPLVHLYYIAIILGTVRFGMSGGLTCAAAAAALSGPLSSSALRPVTTDVLLGWGVRAGVFLLIAAVLAVTLRGRDRAVQLQLSDDVAATLEHAGRPRAAVDPELVDAVPEMLRTRAFHPVFQPVYALDDGRLLAVEALTRFDAGPPTTPDRWFAAAASAGLGVDLELAAIEAAVAASADLPAHVELSLNTSPQTIADPRLLQIVSRTDRAILLEVTEHAAIADYPLLRSSLADLCAAGVRIAVDDAGSGFASLQHVVQLEPAVIKLDISLAQDLAGSPLRRALAESMVEFAHRIGAQLTVEGIEDDDDLAAWVALGADAAQGYLLARPGALPVPMLSAAVRVHSTRATP